MRWRFAELEFQTRPLRLTRAGSPVALQPQPARALQLLLSRAGEVVLREELRAHLWSEGTHLDHEQAINFTIRKIRKALGDEAAVPRFIETVPRLGYRFVAQVERLEPCAPSPHAGEPSARDAHTAGADAAVARGWPIGIALAAAALVALFALTRFEEPGVQEPAAQGPGAEVSKLAVLPLTAAGIEMPDAALAAVMTEELVTQFAQSLAPRLGVVALRSAQVYEDSDHSVEEIGSQLGADYLVRGNVAGTGERLRITVRLLRVDDQIHLWGEAFETDAAALPGWYGEVTRQVAAALGVEPLVRAAAESEPSIPPAAYEAYLRGRYLVSRSDTESIERGAQALEGTIAAAPRFAKAHAALAQAHYELASRRSYADHMRSAEAAARQALRLDDRLVDAHLLLGKILLVYQRDWPAAGREYELALALSPLSAYVVHAYGVYLASVGRFDESLSSIHRAVDLDPATIYASSDLAYVYFLARRYDEAIAQERKHLELLPGNLGSHLFLFRCLEAIGDDKGAVEHYNAAVAILGLPTLRPAESLPEAVANTFEHIRGLDPTVRNVSGVEIAYGHILQGRTDRALEQLRVECESQTSWDLVFLAVDPRFDSLHADPRWEEDLAECLAPLGT